MIRYILDTDHLSLYERSLELNSARKKPVSAMIMIYFRSAHEISLRIVPPGLDRLESLQSGDFV
jgi:hypothetical protein